jgi:hypothetical protein
LCRASSSARASSGSVSDIRAGLKEVLRGKKIAEPVKSELEQYLEEPLDDANLEDEFDILSWWKLKSVKYPVLARLTRDILAVPISTVASESTFSTSGRTLSPARNSLNDESLEALICGQDWLRAPVTGIISFPHFTLNFSNLVGNSNTNIDSFYLFCREW